MNDTFNMENMGNNPSSPNELDSKLMSLAMYDCSNGRVVVPKDSEEYVNIVKKAAKTFNIFKTYIQSGECTFVEINQMVMNRCGPNLKSKNIDIHKNPDLYIEDILSDIAIREQREASIRNASTSDLLASILSQFANGSLANAKRIDLGNGVEARVLHVPFEAEGRTEQNPFSAKENILNKTNDESLKLYNKEDAEKQPKVKKPRKARKSKEDSK